LGFLFALSESMNRFAALSLLLLLAIAWQYSARVLVPAPQWQASYPIQAGDDDAFDDVFLKAKCAGIEPYKHCWKRGEPLVVVVTMGKAP
jgi:hypothetical protein